MTGRTRRVRSKQTGGEEKPKLSIHVDRIADLVATALVTSVATIAIERSFRKDG